MKSNPHTKRLKVQEFAKIQSGVFLTTTPQGEIAYLQIKDLLAETPEKTVSRIPYSPKLEKYFLQNGDVLFAGKGTSNLCRVVDFEAPAIASTTFYIIRIYDGDILPDYLCWYLSQPKTLATIKAGQVGTGTPLIRKQLLENLEIAIPDMKTQQQIVELAKLQQKEVELLKAITEKRNLITNQLIMNKLK
ncbi:MAG: restriction endonuclease subunit S [Bacteroidales bacterium]|nr:restriction endonuclease subunit S [Bacteroidales bacterium]